MEIRYGKTRVVFFRLAKRNAPPFAASVDIDVFGERFKASYTEGDNTEVVATDTMKNFVYATAAEFTDGPSRRTSRSSAAGSSPHTRRWSASA